MYITFTKKRIHFISKETRDPDDPVNFQKVSRRNKNKFYLQEFPGKSQNFSSFQECGGSLLQPVATLILTVLVLITNLFLVFPDLTPWMAFLFQCTVLVFLPCCNRGKILRKFPLISQQLSKISKDNAPLKCAVFDYSCLYADWMGQLLSEKISIYLPQK